MQDSDSATPSDGEADVKTLRAELDRFRDALVAIPNGIVQLDADRRLIFANPAAAEYLGFSSIDELLRTSEEDILRKFEIIDAERGSSTPDDLPGRRALRGDPSPETNVHYRVRATGDERWANVQA
jgi:PAS domain-containing protein